LRNGAADETQEVPVNRTHAKKRSHLVAALIAVSISLSLVPASAGAAGSAAETRAIAPATRSHGSVRVEAATAATENSNADVQSQHARALMQATMLIRKFTAASAVYRTKTWHMERVMTERVVSRPVPVPKSTSELEAARYRMEIWRSRAASDWQRFTNPPNYSSWLCIRSHETAPPFDSWRTDSKNGYYGGVQMNSTFMQQYGSYLLALKGNANHWTKLEQIWVAERGRRVQGWGAWPATSRMCGLR
jgi:hypothetical protein